MQFPDVLLLTSFACACFMAGLIWFVQVVHYPQFADVGADAFAAYHRRHTHLTTRVVVGPMLLELLSGLLLLFIRPAGVPAWTIAAAAALLAVAWASTWLVQVPLHERLALGGHDPKLGSLLCRTNWVRTIAWTIRSLVLGVAVTSRFEWTA